MTSKSTTLSLELLRPPAQNWQPHDYQKDTIKFLLQHAYALLLLDPGLGKTSITLAAFKLLKTKGLAKRALVIAPLMPCLSVWDGSNPDSELRKWKDFKDLTTRMLHGPKKDKLLAGDRADIDIINPEGLEWLFGATKVKLPNGKFKFAVDMKRVKALGYDTLIIDEITMFKHHGSGRFKILKEVLDTFDRRWGLTGSVASNGLMDLFGQVYMIDGGKSLGKFITHYRNRYFYQPSLYVYAPLPGAEAQINQAIVPFTHRLAAEDYLKLPELLHNPIMVAMPPKAYAIYDQVDQAMFAQFDAGKVAPANAAVAVGKCRQLASGGVYTDPFVDPETLLLTPRDYQHVHDAKTEALETLHDSLGGTPLLVAYEYGHDLLRLRKLFGKDVPYVGGGVTRTRALELQALWNAGKLPVLLGHPKTMARGLNLQFAGNHICWYTLTYDYELFDQLIRRIRRQGSKHEVVHNHMLISRGTVDQAVWAALKRKGRGQNALYEALKELQAERRQRAA